jgi:hypothetical protein
VGLQVAKGQVKQASRRAGQRPSYVACASRPWLVSKRLNERRSNETNVSNRCGEPDTQLSRQSGMHVCALGLSPWQPWAHQIPKR